MTVEEILNTLDHYNINPYWTFFSLNYPYSYTIDSRLNIFRDIRGNWAIVCETLGYNPRAGGIILELTYLGNCLINLPFYNGYSCNHTIVTPLNCDQFQTTVDAEALKPDAEYWIVRNEKVFICHNPEEYYINAIELKEFENSGRIRPEEACRLAILKFAHLFRATDEELCQFLPHDLKKIMVLDKWYHNEFHLQYNMFDDPDFIRRFDTDNESVKKYVNEEKAKRDQQNQEEWHKNRPSSQETWQQIAQVITTGVVSLYQPSQNPNSHWSNWPGSGCL